MKILVIDDNPKDTERLSRWLVNEGELLVCPSGTQADAILTESGTGFDVALVSWDMAGAYNGRELLARHRKNLPQMRIIVMSQSLSTETITISTKLGADRHLQKPLHSDRVLDRLRSLKPRPKLPPPYFRELRRKIVGESTAIRQMLSEIEIAIGNPRRGVLILGETGTGKELIARAIHDHSSLPKAPFVPINCAELQETLVESELFGYVKGAFTGALTNKIGRFKAADGGTIFLDEIGDLPRALQAKLLRALQERELTPVGATHPVAFDARIISATNAPLTNAINQGLFRLDLYHRLADLTINVKPLRERREDVPFLAYHFIELHGHGRPLSLSREALSFLCDFPFNGNVRELEGMIRDALDRCDGHKIRPDHFNLEETSKHLDLAQAEVGQPASPPPEPLVPSPKADQLSFPEDWLTLPLLEAEKNIVKAFNHTYLTALQIKHHYNKTNMADEAKVDRKTLDKHLKKAGLAKPSSRSKRHKPPPGGEEE